MFQFNLFTIARHSLRAGLNKIQAFTRKGTVRLAFLGILILVVTKGRISLPSFGGASHQNWLGADVLSALQTRGGGSSEESDALADLNLANEATAVSDALTDDQKAEAAKFSNLGFLLNPGLAERKNVDPAIVAAKNKIVYDYINRYLATAKEEAKTFNIPVSITLAQGLLESNCGESKLSKRDNNHFGIKCQDKCIGCRCANYTDDTRYDMFRIFDSAWESFRAHSKLLTGKRYKHLLKLPLTDYRNWAYGLKSAGYATDKNYAEKLIAIIEALKLNEYDR